MSGRARARGGQNEFMSISFAPYLSQRAVGDQGVGVQRLPSDRRDRVLRQRLVDRCPLVCAIGSGFAG